MNTNAKILVVDHFAAMRWVIGNLLRELGFSQIEQAADAEGALACLRAGGFDLMVTDCNLPGMDGFALLKGVREDTAFNGLSVVMIASESRRSKILEAVELGVDGYIVKPFTARKLKAVLEKLLQENWIDVG